MRPSKNGIPLEGIKQMPDYIVKKFNEVERYLPGTVVFTETDEKRIRKVIKLACAEIRKRRQEAGWV